jgi:hypothetical protein
MTNVNSKVCFKCKVEKPVSEFHKYKERFQSYCKACSITIGTKWKKENRERHLFQKRKRYESSKDIDRNSKYKRKYGITLEEYNKMLENQNGLCAICNSPEKVKTDDKVKLLAVDHCHTSGAVRGLLCNACNTGIGKFKEDINILESAIKYLKTHTKD